MKGKVIRSAPSWRKEGVRFVRPELWLVAMGVVSGLLVEVSQSARVAEISMELDKTRSTPSGPCARLGASAPSWTAVPPRAALSPRVALGPAARRGSCGDPPAEYLANPAAQPAKGAAA
jgi:hypothetical protein